MRNFRSVVVFLVLGVAVVGGVLFLAMRPRRLEPIDESRVKAGLPAQVAKLVNQTAAIRQLTPVPDARVYMVLRERGARLTGGWYEGKDAHDALIKGLEQISSEQAALADRADTIELCFPHSEEKAKLREDAPVLHVNEFGVKGLVLTHGDRKERVCPTDMIATNRSFADVEKRFRGRAKLSKAEYVEKVSARTFDAYQFLVRLKGSPAIISMFRGNQTIPQSAVNQESTQKLKDLLAHWLTTQVQPDGRMVYRFFPSRGKEAENDNNMIRQFMATVALVRLGNELKDARITELARKNLRYNLDHFFQKEGEYGLIRWKDVRLGAIALACLAIVEAPFRKEFEEYEVALRKSTEFMLREDGSFQTFWDNRQSSDNQNFYPGETQLLWATLYMQTRDKQVLERIQRAFRYYRTWHLDEKNRNPAFVPWHTQALVRVLLLEDHPEMREFVFEINDWLLSMQQNDAPYPDQLGRFHDPKRPKFGPPHASSTAVYLEGLIDAYRLAKHVKDEKRAKTYRDAIERGLRALMQIQFQDGVDLYYVSAREHVYGGLRTTEYDNSIRVDNVQHALMGLQRIVRTFADEGKW